MSKFVTLAEIAEALGVSKQAVAQRADREAWPYTEEAVRGGKRRLYDPATLPKDVQKAVKARGQRIQAVAAAAGQAADGDAARRMLEEAARTGKLKGRELMEAAEQARADAFLNRQTAGIEILRRWPTLTPNQVKRMQARLEIVQAYQRWIEVEGLRPGNKALNAFATTYTTTGGGRSEETRAVIKKLSGRNLRRWVDGFAQRGLAALLDEKDGSAAAGHGKIEDQPEMREFVVGLLIEFPHIKDTAISTAIGARFGTRLAPVAASLKDARAAGLLARPEVDAIKRFRLRFIAENSSAYLALRNPDKWKNEHMVAFGDAAGDVVRPNYRWELDSTPGDVLLLDPAAPGGTARYSVLGAVDVFTRRGKLLVSKTSKSLIVGSLVRRAILDWGRPERIKHDNGSDYCAQFLQVFYDAIGTEPELCAPFSGWQKPHVERFLKTFNHDLVELLPGFIGHNVAERKEIEARASFAQRLFQKDGVLEVRMTPDDFQTFCDDWCDNVYAHNEHEGLDRRTPFQVAASWSEPVARITDERALDVLLAPLAGRNGIFTLQKKGIKIDGDWFIAPFLGAHAVGTRYRVRQDVADAGRVFVFDAEGDFQGVAICPVRTGISPAEMAAQAKVIQRETVKEQKAALKEIAKKAQVKDIAHEVLKARAEAAGKLAALPPRGPQHTTAAIQAAGRAAMAGDAPQPSSEHEALMAESRQAIADYDALQATVAEAAKASAAIAGNVTAHPASAEYANPLRGMDAAGRYDFWLTLHARKQRGETLDDAWQESWYAGFQGSSNFRSQRALREARQQAEAF